MQIAIWRLGLPAKRRISVSQHKQHRCRSQGAKRLVKRYRGLGASGRRSDGCSLALLGREFVTLVSGCVVTGATVCREVDRQEPCHACPEGADKVVKPSAADMEEDHHVPRSALTWLAA